MRATALPEAVAEAVRWCKAHARTASAPTAVPIPAVVSTRAAQRGR